jgi:hypothetical protein
VAHIVDEGEDPFAEVNRLVELGVKASDPSLARDYMHLAAEKRAAVKADLAKGGSRSSVAGSQPSRSTRPRMRVIRTPSVSPTMAMPRQQLFKAAAEVARLEKCASDFAYVDRTMAKDYREMADKLRKATAATLQKMAGASPQLFVEQMGEILQKSAGSDVVGVQQEILGLINREGAR